MTDFTDEESEAAIRATSLCEASSTFPMVAPPSECVVRSRRHLVAVNRSYDTDDLRSRRLLHGALTFIPAKVSRLVPIAHDAAVYRTRNRVECLVSKLKQFRRVATRYDQTAASFLAFVELAALRIWTRYVHAT